MTGPEEDQAHQLGLVLTCVWIALLFAAWIGFFAATIHDAFKGTLRRQLQGAVAEIAQEETERWGLSHRTTPVEKR